MTPDDLYQHTLDEMRGKRARTMETIDRENAKTAAAFVVGLSIIALFAAVLSLMTREPVDTEQASIDWSIRT